MSAKITSGGMFQCSGNRGCNIIFTVKEMDKGYVLVPWVGG